MIVGVVLDTRLVVAVLVEVSVAGCGADVYMGVGARSVPDTAPVKVLLVLLLAGASGCAAAAVEVTRSPPGAICVKCTSRTFPFFVGPCVTRNCAPGRRSTSFSFLTWEMCWMSLAFLMSRINTTGTLGLDTSPAHSYATLGSRLVLLKAAKVITLSCS